MKQKFLYQYITMGLTWIHHCNSNPNQHTVELIAPGEPPLKRPKTKFGSTATLKKTKLSIATIFLREEIACKRFRKKIQYIFNWFPSNYIWLLATFIFFLPQENACRKGILIPWRGYQCISIFYMFQLNNFLPLHRCLRVLKQFKPKQYWGRYYCQVL